jgi:hypothetical protein
MDTHCRYPLKYHCRGSSRSHAQQDPHMSASFQIIRFHLSYNSPPHGRVFFFVSNLSVGHSSPSFVRQFVLIGFVPVICWTQLGTCWAQFLLSGYTPFYCRVQFSHSFPFIISLCHFQCCSAPRTSICIESPLCMDVRINGERTKTC